MRLDIFIKLLVLSLLSTLMGNVYADSKLSELDTSNHCRATYAVDEGTLSVPCVKVLNPTEGPPFYSAELQQLPETEPLQFSITRITESNGENQEDSCLATLDDGTLFIPCVEVSKNGDTQTYEASLEQTAFGKSLRFTVIEINEADNSPARKQRRSARKKSYGTELGSFNGVKVYSNGSAYTVSDVYNFIDGKNIGMKWQCVEYIRRYYYRKFWINLGDKHRGHAKTFWGSVAAHNMQLGRFSNGGSVAPKVGDIVVSDKGTNGHVAIVRSVSGNQMCVAQQNVYQTESDVNACTTLSISNGKYTVGNFSNTTLPITGWLRLKTVDISRNGQNIVDDKEDALWNGGTQSYWKKGYNTGYDSRVLYTYANASQNEDNYCKWNVNIVDPGTYEVSAHVPSNYATSQQAKYKIWTGSKVEYSTISQQDYSNQWVKLGAYDFQAGLAAIKLSDNTGESSSLKRTIACDAIKFVYKDGNSSSDGNYSWTGNGSIISYHGSHRRNIPSSDDDHPFGLTIDETMLQPNLAHPVGFFQWQVDKQRCNRLEIYTKDRSPQKADITIGSWRSRDDDRVFSNVTLPFVIGEKNTGFNFGSGAGNWYVFSVAFKDRVFQATDLYAECTTKSTGRWYDKRGMYPVMLDGGYKWNGNASIISHRFRNHKYDQPDKDEQWPFAAFKDVTIVHPSPEKPVVFFQWHISESCPRLTIETGNSSSPQVTISAKGWDSSQSKTVNRRLPVTLYPSDAGVSSTPGNWAVIKVAFDRPVSEEIGVYANCPGY